MRSIEASSLWPGASPGAVGESGPPPDVLVHLQDEGAGPVAVRVAMYLHDPGRGVQDVELERIEHQVRAQPDVLGPPSFQIWPERSGVRAPGQRIRPVGGDHQVVIRRQGRYVRCLGAEQDPYPELRASRLQDGQQPLAAHRREAVPARGKSSRAPVHVDVVPAGELPAHPGEDLDVGVLDAAQGLVGEHHPETERVVGGVALPDRDVMPGVELPGQCREIQAARTAAQDRDTHGAHSFRACRPIPSTDRMPELLRSSTERNIVPVVLSMAKIGAHDAWLRTCPHRYRPMSPASPRRLHRGAWTALLYARP